MNETALAILTTVGTLLCFSLLCIKIGLVSVHLLRRRSHSIPYIRNYKKGSFISNYVVMLLIYFVGNLYKERNLFAAFSSSVSETADFIVLKFNTAHIGTLMSDSFLYRITVYGGYALLVFGTVLLTLSLLQQYFWCVKNAFFAQITRKEKMYLIGLNPENLSIYESDGKRRFKYIVAKMKKEDCDALYIDNMPYVSTDPQKWLEHFLSRSFRWQLKKKSIFVINTGEDKTNIALCKRFLETLGKASAEEREAMFGRMRVVVFGDPKYQAIYENLANKGLGCIHYINKYQKIAIDFIDRYPLTLFMDEEQIDYATSLLKENVDVNVALVGFGKTNRQILLSSVAINQFLKASENGPVHKPIKYFIFDKNHAEQNKNLNHDYYRFKQKLETWIPRTIFHCLLFPPRKNIYIWISMTLISIRRSRRS